VSVAVVAVFCVVDVVSETEGEPTADPFFTSETVIVSAAGFGEIGVAETYSELNVHPAGIRV